MSRLSQPNGDDHPEAARKHLTDATALIQQNRCDGAAYLSGYVVECALKSLYLLETGKPLTGHSFSSLLSQVSAVATVAGAKTARYLGTATQTVVSSPIGNWRPGLRYQGPAVSEIDARMWHDAAKKVFAETVHLMTLDGVI